MKVVFDTNVLISALLWPDGSPAIAVAIARQGRIRSLVSLSILEEFRRILLEKFKFEFAVVETAVQILVEHSEVIQPRHAVQVIKADPPDNRILECAADGRADVLVTGDNHLLALETFQKIPILTPRMFLDRFFPSR